MGPFLKGRDNRLPGLLPEIYFAFILYDLSVAGGKSVLAQGLLLSSGLCDGSGYASTVAHTSSCFEVH